MSEKTEIISNAPLFRGLPADQIEKISRIAVTRNFSKNETIFSEGDAGSGFFIVSTGMVKIFKSSPEGKEQILHIFGPGEPFGEVPVFTRQSFPASAQALCTSRLLFFPINDFVHLVTQNPSLSLNMLAVLSQRLKQFTLQIESLSLKEVPGRLATYLIYLSEEQKRQDAVTLNIPKGQLASLLGTIPETLSRILGKMSDQNLIEVNGKEIKIIDSAALKEIANHGKQME